MEEADEAVDPFSVGRGGGFCIGGDDGLLVGVAVGLTVGVAVGLTVGVAVGLAFETSFGLGVEVEFTVSCATGCPLMPTGTDKDTNTTSSKDSATACFKKIVAPPIQRHSLISKGT